MLSIKLISIGAEDYYLALATEDYYLQGGEPPGRWIGGACEHLGLSGLVEPESFRRIFRGYHPTNGDPLVQNAGKSTRQAGWDLTYSAPKSLSVIWSGAPLEIRQRIEELHFESISRTFTFLESAFGHSRVGKAGRGGLVPAKLAAAVFEHGTSRAADPQLHSHTLLLNLGVDQNGATRSIVSRPFYRNKMLLGAMYRSNLAHLLERELGFRARKKGNVFEVEGVPKQLMEAYSTRSKEVRAHMAKRGQKGAKAAAIAALETRRTKRNVPPRKELFEIWHQINESHGFDARAIADLTHLDARDSVEFVPEILQTATSNVTREKPHFTAQDFLREALSLSVEYGVSPEQLLAPARAYLKGEESIIPIHTLSGETRYTTASILERELSLLDSLQVLRDRPGAFVEERVLARTLKRWATLSPDQLQAVRHLTQSNSAVRMVRGFAGTGKTTMLKACLAAWNKAGFHVIGAAPTGAAAQVLQEETGIESDTIHMTLGDFDTKFGFKVKYHLKQGLRAVLGKRTYRLKNPQPVQITPKTVLVVDEASMVNTRHFQMLVEHVRKGGGTLVFAGDPAQLPAVSGGSPFLSVSNRIGCARLTEIKRQKDEWARTASRLLANGHAGSALAIYAEKNLIRVRDDIDQALSQLVLDWTEVGLTTPSDAAILTLTNTLAHAANELCQKKRIEAGLLDPTISVKITDQHDEDTVFQSQVHPGDRVLFTNVSRKYGVCNGNLGTVVCLGRMKQSIVVDLDNGKRVNVPLSFKHMRLGYAMTTHKAQGSTFSDVFVLLGGSTQNLPLSYVQGTRSRLSTRFYAEKAVLDEYLEDVEDSLLASQMERQVDLSLATDLFVKPTESDSDREELIEKLLSRWKTSDISKIARRAIITCTEDDKEEFNRRCHDILYALAQIDWTDRLNRKGQIPEVTIRNNRLIQGDRIRFLHGSFAHKIAPDDLAIVRSVSPENESLELSLDKGHEVTLPLDAVPSFERAFAFTNEQANAHSLEVDTAYLFDPRPSSPAFDQSPSPSVDFFASTQPAFTTPTVFDPQPTPVATQNTWQAQQTETFQRLEYQAAQTQCTQRAFQANQQVQTQYQQQATTRHYIEPAAQQISWW